MLTHHNMVCVCNCGSKVYYASTLLSDSTNRNAFRANWFQANTSIRHQLPRAELCFTSHMEIRRRSNAQPEIHDKEGGRNAAHSSIRQSTQFQFVLFETVNDGYSFHDYHHSHSQCRTVNSCTKHFITA
jgi:hypothetical protein